MVQDRTIQALSIRKNNNANNAVHGTDFYDFLSIKKRMHTVFKFLATAEKTYHHFTGRAGQFFLYFPLNN